MTLFGTERKLYGVNVLPLLWLVCMVVYTAGASAAMDNGLNLRYSKTLDRNVSQWCTVDKTCEGDICYLNWNWDNINVEWRFWFYWGVVFILPVASLDNWLIWALLLSVHAIISFALGTKSVNVISSASASCFWAPLVTLLIQLSTLPKILQDLCNNNTPLGKPRVQRYTPVPLDLRRGIVPENTNKEIESIIASTKKNRPKNPFHDNSANAKEIIALARAKNK
jgi:hypothetical protein